MLKGSLPAPLLFTLYTVPIGFLLVKHDIGSHLCADAAQIVINIDQPWALKLLPMNSVRSVVSSGCLTNFSIQVLLRMLSQLKKCNSIFSLFWNI